MKNKKNDMIKNFMINKCGGGSGGNLKNKLTILEDYNILYGQPIERLINDQIKNLIRDANLYVKDNGDLDILTIFDVNNFVYLNNNNDFINQLKSSFIYKHSYSTILLSNSEERQSNVYCDIINYFSEYVENFNKYEDLSLKYKLTEYFNKTDYCITLKIIDEENNDTNVEIENEENNSMGDVITGGEITILSINCILIKQLEDIEIVKNMYIETGKDGLNYFNNAGLVVFTNWLYTNSYQNSNSEYKLNLDIYIRLLKVDPFQFYKDIIQYSFNFLNVINADLLHKLIYKWIEYSGVNLKSIIDENVLTYTRPFVNSFILEFLKVIRDIDSETDIAVVGNEAIRRYILPNVSLSNNFIEICLFGNENISYKKNIIFELSKFVVFLYNYKKYIFPENEIILKTNYPELSFSLNFLLKDIVQFRIRYDKYKNQYCLDYRLGIKVTYYSQTFQFYKDLQILCINVNYEESAKLYKNTIIPIIRSEILSLKIQNDYTNVNKSLTKIKSQEYEIDKLIIKNLGNNILSENLSILEKQVHKKLWDSYQFEEFANIAKKYASKINYVIKNNKDLDSIKTSFITMDIEIEEQLEYFCDKLDGDETDGGIELSKEFAEESPDEIIDILQEMKF